MKKIIVVIIILSLVIGIMIGCDKKNESLEKVTFVLDWTPNTNHTGIYVAKELGYFKENGLDVSIIQPSEGTAEQLVASGSADYGISYQETVILARVEQIPIVSIAAIIQHNTSGFISKVEENIKSVKDFENKKYGGWGSDIEQATIKYLMEQEAANYSKTEIITTGDIDFFIGTETGNIDYSWVFEGWTLKQAEIEKIEVNYIDIGKISEVFDYYTPVIITSEKNIVNDKITAKFMDAVKKGYKYSINNPEEAAKVLLRAAPELNDQLVLQSQIFLSTKYKDDANYWGEQKNEVWKRYMLWLYENEIIDSLLIIENAYTNKYTK